MFQEGFDYSHFKPRKSTTKEMRHIDTVQRRKQEIPINNNNDEDTDLPPLNPHLLTGVTRSLSIRLSSSRRSGLDSQFMSETFGALDTDMSGIGAAGDDPSSEEPQT